MPVISDSIGRVLGGRYRLVSALGAGASAHVFLAEDVTLQRRVAVKVLQPGLAKDESFLKRFRAEARSVASLNHPHVLRVFDWGEDADGPFLVLEYLAGRQPARHARPAGTRLSHAQAARVGVRGGRGARLRPRPGPGPPGREAGQPALRRGGPGAHRRLRGGPGPGRGGLDRAGRGHDRHRPLRLARAGPGSRASTAGPTCTRWPSCSTRRSPARCPSWPGHHDRRP